MPPPSLVRLAHDARRTAVRFPLALASGALVAGLTMATIAGPDRDWVQRLALIAGLGFSSFTGAAVVGERYRLRPPVRRAMAGALVALLALLFAHSTHVTFDLLFLEVCHLALATHLLVAVAPFLGPGETPGFWQWNRILFLRYLLASFYTFVLWAGLAIALVAIDKLLGIRIDGEAYGHLAAFLAFVVHPWFFLAGVPSDFDVLDRTDVYPLGLKVFAQFVLLPLVTVYLAILTLYLGRVVVTRTWPRGWIGYLVSSVSAAGVLALLLLHPLRQRADSRWIDRFGRWFFIALIPALVMVLLAAGKRIEQYGVTERRYFLLVLALWMLGLALWYGLSGSRAIRSIPLTLAGIALVTWFGPWGAYRTSYRSQVGRLAKIVAANGLGAVGRVHPPNAPLPFADRKELSGVLDYLATTRGTDAMARVIGLDSTALLWRPGDSTIRAPVPAATAMARLGMVYVSRWETSPSAPNFNRPFWPAAIRQTGGATIDLQGFETLSQVPIIDTATIAYARDSLTVRFRWRRPTVRLERPGAAPVVIDLNSPLLALIREPGAASGAVPNPIVIDRDTAGFAVRLILNQLSGTVTADSVLLTGGTATLLLGRRR